MATIKEDYVSYEVAKLLKEKGFDGVCNRVYQGPNLKYTTIPISPLMSLGEFGGFHPKQLYVTNKELGDIAYTAPTLQMAMKWLRVVHGLHIYTFRLGEKWHYEIQVFKEGYTYSKVGGDSHDEAVEKAIWYCVNNLI